MPALAMIGAMLTPISLSIIVADDGQDDAGDDALEQRAHRLGPLDAAGGAGRLVEVEGGADLAAGHRAAEPVGQHAGLGALDDPVDDPVQDPPDDQSQQGEAEQGERLADHPVGDVGGRRAVGLAVDEVADGRVVGAGIVEREHRASMAIRAANPSPRRRSCDRSDGRTAEAAGSGSRYRVPRDHVRALVQHLRPSALAPPGQRCGGLRRRGRGRLSRPRPSADVPEGWSNPEDVDTLLRAAAARRRAAAPVRGHRGAHLPPGDGPRREARPRCGRRPVVRWSPPGRQGARVRRPAPSETGGARGRW